MANQKNETFASPYPADKVLREHMLALAKAYSKASETPVSLKTLGERVLRDHRFFVRLDEGEGSFTAPKYDQVLEWFAVAIADGRSEMKWPDGVPMPSPRAVARAKQTAE